MGCLILWIREAADPELGFEVKHDPPFRPRCIDLSELTITVIYWVTPPFS